MEHKCSTRAVPGSDRFEAKLQTTFAPVIVPLWGGSLVDLRVPGGVGLQIVPTPGMSGRARRASSHSGVGAQLAPCRRRRVGARTAVGRARPFQHFTPRRHSFRFSGGPACSDGVWSFAVSVLRSEQTSWLSLVGASRLDPHIISKAGHRSLCHTRAHARTIVRLVAWLWPSWHKEPCGLVGVAHAHSA